MNMVLKGKAWKFGDHFDSDNIIPMEIIRIFKFKPLDPKELVKHCCVSLYPQFPKKVEEGDVIVAGRNFGCGHGLHWEGPIALKTLGISVIVAESFARDFYRTAINFGLPLLPCKDVSDNVNQGDNVEVNLTTGEVKDLTTGVTLKTDSFPRQLTGIIEAGDIKAYLKKTLGL